MTKVSKHKPRKGGDPWAATRPFHVQTPGLHGAIPKTIKQVILATPALEPVNYHLQSVSLGLFPEPMAAPIATPAREEICFPPLNVEFHVPTELERQITESWLVENRYPANHADTLKVQRDLRAHIDMMKERFGLRNQNKQLWGEHDGNA